MFYHQIKHFAFSQSGVFGSHKVADNSTCQQILRTIMLLQTSEPVTKHKSPSRKFQPPSLKYKNL